MKINLSQILQTLKKWETDYTPSIYLSRIFGYALSSTYFVFNSFDMKKTREFTRKKNYFVFKKNELIKKHNKFFDDQFNNKFLKEDIYDFNGVYLPKTENIGLIRNVYSDTLKIYTEKKDNYNYHIVDEMDKTLPEGSYCYIGPNGEDITIKPGYNVIDAGAWIGDFSAYASKKGAHSYAFEPSPINIKFLEKTVKYNRGNGGVITIVPYGLGDREEDVGFIENDEYDNSGGSSFDIPKGRDSHMHLHVTTIDSWIKKNNIGKIDFIKADIEGYERKMLKGAEKTLKEHEPILSICTYHYPDDPQVLRDIIIKANPKYKIIQRKKKLFAYV
ncbi:MAG: FkbM family methyltransferase [bacterium]